MASSHCWENPSALNPAGGGGEVLLLLGALAIASAFALSDGDHLPFTLLPADPAAGCRGSVAECLAIDELGLGGDLHRRVLYGSGYISYAALCRGSIPCSHRGARYYNCRPGTQANPYHCGFSCIARYFAVNDPESRVRACQ